VCKLKNEIDNENIDHNSVHWNFQLRIQK
jgi:hypothetical protein